MANKKISQLTNGNPPQSTDKIPVARGGTNVYITAGDLAGGGYPSGANVVAPIRPYANGSAGLAGYTVVFKIPASYIQAFNANGFRVGIQTTSVLGLVVNRASIAKTLPGDTVWTTAPVAFTWPGGAFASANALYLSNVCAVAGDASHDLYVMVYFDPTSAGGNAYATQTTGPTEAGWAIYNTLSGYVSGDHTNDSDASGLQSLGGGALFCFQQIITA